MRRVLAAAAATFLCAALVACGGSAATAPTAATGSSPASATATAPAAAPGGKTMTVAIWSAPDSFNPVTAPNGYDYSAIGLMFDTLVWQSPDQAFHPLLASSWSASADATTFTFHINPAATWTDGQPVTSADVQYSFDVATDPAVPSHVGSFLSLVAGTTTQGKNTDPSQPLAGVKIVDPTTFQLVMKGPTDISTLLADIGINVYVIPQHALKDVAAADFAKAPFFQNPTVTDGAFSFVKYVNSQYVEYRANPKFFLGAPKLATLYLKVVPPTSMLSELRDGEIDATLVPGESDVPLQDWPSIATLPNVKQDPVQGTVLQMMYINDSRPYFQSPLVRQAITMATNRQEIVTQLLKGQGSLAIGPIDPILTQWVDSSLKPYPYDPAKAKQMLQQAGFPFSQPLVLVVPTGNQARQESGPLLQQDLQAVGLKVSIEQYDFATAYQMMTKGTYDFGLIGTGFGSDPSLSAAWFTCNGSLDREHFCDPQMAPLYDAALKTGDATQKKAIYDQIQQRIYTEAPMVFLYYADGLMAYNTRINQAAVPTVYGMLEPWLWDIQS